MSLNDDFWKYAFGFICGICLSLVLVSLRVFSQSKKRLGIFGKPLNLRRGTVTPEVSDYNILKGAAVVISTAVLSWASLYFVNVQKEKALGKEYINLGFEILEKPAKDNTVLLRKWAVELIDHYSDIEMKQPLKDELVYFSSIIGRYEVQEKWDWKNLSVIEYRDSTPIDQARTPGEWRACNYEKRGCYCYPGFKPANKKYGLLYNYYAVADSHGLAPEGWAIATMDIFKKLIFDNGFPKFPSMDTQKRWANLFTEKPELGLDQLFHGGYVDSIGERHGMGVEARWWTIYSPKAHSEREYYYYSITNDSVTWNPINKKQGYYVRCVRDSIGEFDN